MYLKFYLHVFDEIELTEDLGTFFECIGKILPDFGEKTAANAINKPVEQNFLGQLELENLKQLYFLSKKL